MISTTSFMAQDVRLAGLITNKGVSVRELSQTDKVLLIFLRHFGCIFCRESLRDLSQRRMTYEGQGIQLVFVHMSDTETADMYFRSFNLDGVHHISDKQCSYYSAFKLGKGNVSQLFGFKNIVRGFEVTIGKGIPVMATQIGDANQMPGVFVIEKGQVTQSFFHSYAGDVPDYDRLVGVNTTDIVKTEKV